MCDSMKNMAEWNGVLYHACSQVDDVRRLVLLEALQSLCFIAEICILAAEKNEFGIANYSRLVLNNPFDSLANQASPACHDHPGHASQISTQNTETTRRGKSLLRLGLVFSSDDRQTMRVFFPAPTRFFYRRNLQGDPMPRLAAPCVLLVLSLTSCTQTSAFLAPPGKISILPCSTTVKIGVPPTGITRRMADSSDAPSLQEVCNRSRSYKDVRIPGFRQLQRSEICTLNDIRKASMERSPSVEHLTCIPHSSPMIGPIVSL
jgi:hypothetical protein